MTIPSEKRRRRGDGTVETRAGVSRFKCPDGNGGRHISAWIYPTPKDAREALGVFRQKVRRGELVPVRGMTLGDFYERRFLPRLERLVERGTRQPGTLGFYRSHWPQLAPLAGTPLAALDVPTISRWVESLEVERPKSFLAVLKAILQAAVSKDFILATNPARDVRVEEEAGDEEDRAPTAEEAAALVDCEAIPLADRLIIAFALGAGLRPGEWRTLELADVHADAAVPYVFVQFGTEDRGDTKTRKKRKVPLLSVALRALGQWLAILPTYCPENPLGLVFPTKRGCLRTNEPFGRRKVGGGKKPKQLNRWHDFLRLAGISRPLTPHGLRHGCVTGLLTGWLGDRLDSWAVQLVAGHGRLATTEKYMHHGERDLFRAVRHQSRNRPNEKPVDRGSAGISAGFAMDGPMVPTGGLEPPDSTQLAIVDGPHAETPPAGTDAGLTSELLERIRAGEWPTRAEALAIAGRERAAVEESHAVLRACRRVESTGAWQSGLYDLLTLLERAEAEGRAGRRG